MLVTDKIIPLHLPREAEPLQTTETDSLPR
jgi:hypothetical protein